LPVFAKVIVMTDETFPSRPVLDAAPGLIGTSSTVTTVFESILADVHNGRLMPGDRLSDGEIATRFGVSRTPVREALQRLREIGIVEASANRFTRIAVVSPRQTFEALTVWLALFSVVIDEVIDRVPPGVLEAMKRDHEEFDRQLMAQSNQGAATANADFFNNLVRLSRNSFLLRGILSVVHVVQLGSLHLPSQVDVATLSASQKMLTDAAEKGDRESAKAAMDLIRTIEVPREPTAPN
jgi:DNA-binding GntR family transcriptional regulator